MARPASYVVVYDVTDDAERTRVAKVIEGFGVRVQKSAFECVLGRGARATLERRLGELQLKSGFVFLYRRDPRAKRLAIGAVPPNPFDEGNYAFVVDGAGAAAAAESARPAQPDGDHGSDGSDGQSA
jgi:CRISPR-associated protein Cas2